MTIAIIIILAFTLIFGLVGAFADAKNGNERAQNIAITAGFGAFQGCGCLVALLIIAGMGVVVLAIFGGGR